MRFSIKKWLIKKLGGYTKDEYVDRQTIIVNTIISKSQSVTLESVFYDNTCGVLTQNKIYEILASKFIRGIKEYMSVKKEKVPNRDLDLYVAHITIQVEENHEE